ncbi:Satratoxin biosynthesis SC1 cluster 4-like protein [Cladobotryum mycophilum]|uniref:Satratoxin biosynthesis SC1 cluster 4-like protein n=1 Tax=Cladobotryum mycophilum TaxID=491253 RepID=A0ABR0T449_9HYPO
MAITDDGIRSIAVVTVLSVLATLAVITRVLLRRKGLLGIDDYLLCFAGLQLWIQAAAAYIIFCTVAVKSGESKHVMMLAPKKMTLLFGVSYVSRLNCTVLLVVVKTSILISYKRIFGHNRITLIQIYVLLGLSWCWGISTFVAGIFQCTPIAKMWKPLKPGTCIDVLAFIWGTSISSFIIDWMILLIPIVPVWKLRITTTQKVLVGGSFAFGSVACIASTIRAVSTNQVDFGDVSKSVIKGSIWAFIEPCLGMISACLPFLSSALGNKIIRMPNPMPSIYSRNNQCASGKAQLGMLSRQNRAYGVLCFGYCTWSVWGQQ